MGVKKSTHKLYGLTVKQKIIADAVLEGKTGADAARMTGSIHTDNSAYSVASRTLRTAKVIEYLQAQAQGAATRIVKISQKKRDDSVKLRANEQILDRALGKPVEYQAVSMQGDVFIHLD